MIIVGYPSLLYHSYPLFKIYVMNASICQSHKETALSFGKDGFFIDSFIPIHLSFPSLYRK